MGYGIFAGVIYDVSYPVIEIYENNVLRLVENRETGKFWVYDPDSRSLQLSVITGSGLASMVIRDAGLSGVLSAAAPIYKNITQQDLSFVLPSVS